MEGRILRRGLSQGQKDLKAWHLILSSREDVDRSLGVRGSGRGRERARCGRGLWRRGRTGRGRGVPRRGAGASGSRGAAAGGSRRWACPLCGVDGGLCRGPGGLIPLARRSQRVEGSLAVAAMAKLSRRMRTGRAGRRVNRRLSSGWAGGRSRNSGIETRWRRSERNVVREAGAHRGRRRLWWVERMVKVNGDVSARVAKLEVGARSVHDQLGAGHDNSPFRSSCRRRCRGGCGPRGRRARCRLSESRLPRCRGRRSCSP